MSSQSDEVKLGRPIAKESTQRELCARSWRKSQAARGRERARAAVGAFSERQHPKGGKSLRRDGRYGR